MKLALIAALTALSVSGCAFLAAHIPHPQAPGNPPGVTPPPGMSTVMTEPSATLVLPPS
jgi:hypothetical protein